jgi:hypothetical protein
MTDYNPRVVENYVKNPDDIMAYVLAHQDLFERREAGTRRAHKPSYTGDASQFSSIFDDNMPEELKELCLKTIPQDRKWLSQVVINKYEPGDYLMKHRDSQGGYYRFKLIWLTEGPPHFCWYDAEDTPHFIQEKKGAMFDMDIGLFHEVTKIQPNEPVKYSMCLIWR